MRVTNFSVQESLMHNGANVMVRITHDDLTATAANTAQTLTILSAVSNSDAIVGLTNFDCRFKGYELVQPFEDTTDAAHNDDQLTVGQQDDTSIFLNAVQLNVNGTEKRRDTGSDSAVGSSGTSVVAVITPAGGKNLAALNKGICDLYFFWQTGAI